MAFFPRVGRWRHNVLIGRKLNVGLGVAEVASLLPSSPEHVADEVSGSDEVFVAHSSGRRARPDQFDERSDLLEPGVAKSVEFAGVVFQRVRIHRVEAGVFRHESGMVFAQGSPMVADLNEVAVSEAVEN